MVATPRRFEFALEGLRSSEWEHFERLCSAFLAAEFPGLRTAASPSGDEGRDAGLFRFDASPTVVFQFSIAQDWKTKVRRTIDRVKSAIPSATVLIYLSNQVIGAAGDALKREALQKGISLDLRDRSWFLERSDADEARKRAADQLARVVVDPLLHNAGVLTNAPAIRGQESRTALVYLEMQSRDEDRSKGLTKLSFEAFVRWALRGTDAANRKSVDEIRSAVQSLLPQHAPAQLNPFIDSALHRLSRGPIKYWKVDETYHLDFEESVRIKDRISGLALLGDAFQDDVEEILRREPAVPEARYIDITHRIRTIIESYFYRLGEEFAQCVVSGTPVPIHNDTLESIVYENAIIGSISSGRPWSNLLIGVCRDILATPSDKTNELLRLIFTLATHFLHFFLRSRTFSALQSACFLMDLYGSTLALFCHYWQNRHNRMTDVRSQQ